MSFINEIAPHAQRHMRESNILASLIIAQAIHESNWGKSGLATKGKNLFGIKGTYGGQSVNMKTWEVYNGKNVMVNAAFRKYPSWYESISDLVSLYKNGVSWDRKKYHRVIGETNYKEACKAVQAAGYATDPNYAAKLIKTIEAHDLTQYDGDVKEKPTGAKPANKKPSNSKAKVYTVKKGDTLSAIAVKYGVTVKQLQSLNGIKDKNQIYAGQKIKLPGTATASPAKKYHTVKSGDTVSELSVKYKTTTAKIKQLNGLKDVNKIFIGQKLRVK